MVWQPLNIYLFGVQTVGSGGSMNRVPELLGVPPPSGATKNFGQENNKPTTKCAVIFAFRYKGS